MNEKVSRSEETYRLFASVIYLRLEAGGRTRKQLTLGSKRRLRALERMVRDGHVVKISADCYLLAPEKDDIEHERKDD